MQGSNQNSNGKHHKLVLRAERSWRASHRIAADDPTTSLRTLEQQLAKPRIASPSLGWPNESPRRSKIDSLSLARREGRIWEGPEETNLPEAAAGRLPRRREREREEDRGRRIGVAESRTTAAYSMGQRHGPTKSPFVHAMRGLGSTRRNPPLNRPLSFSYPNSVRRHRRGEASSPPPLTT
jgi:hypothetical protein